MAIEVPNQNEPSVTSLLGGIVNDFQDLIKQQLRLTRQEIVTDIRKGKEAASLLVVGMAIAVLGVFALCMMLAHLLHWLGTPSGAAGADPSSLPLWASFGLVGGAFVLAGGLTILAGKKKLDTVSDPLQDTAQALKENIEWKTKASPS